MRRSLRPRLRIESLESRLALAVDLSVAVSDGDVEVHPGDTLVYHLEYANLGDTEATGVKLGEVVLPRAAFNADATTSEWDCGMAMGPAFLHCRLEVGTLAPGATGTADFAITVPSDTTRFTHTLWNFARISDDGANGHDANRRNNHDVERTLVLPPASAVDLKIDVSDGDATATPGGSLVYTVNYANAGGGDATGVVIRQVLPAFTRFDEAASSTGWVCTAMLTANTLHGGGTVCTLEVGALAAGTEASATLGVSVAPELPSYLTHLTTTASISTRPLVLDPTPHNNFDIEHTPISRPPAMAPDLKITSDDGGGPVAPGGTITYALSYANTGTGDATGVVLIETVPPYTHFNAAESSDGWRCANVLAVGITNALGTCVLHVGDLAAGATGTARFAVTVAERLPSTLRAIRNVVRIRDDGTHGHDPTPENNVAVTETPVEHPAGSPVLYATRR